MLIKPNRYYTSKFKWDRLGFLLITHKWIIATRFYARVWN